MAKETSFSGLSNKQKYSIFFDDSGVMSDSTRRGLTTADF